MRYSKSEVSPVHIAKERGHRRVVEIMEKAIRCKWVSSVVYNGHISFMK